MMNHFQKKNICMLNKILYLLAKMHNIGKIGRGGCKNMQEIILIKEIIFENEFGELFY